ncbi:MAG: alpha/beta hydrolase [Cyclobacteriaceae bacterium]|nr:alpha/beta hydrolase [Cyclobacteriaceae bacterium]
MKTIAKSYFKGGQDDLNYFEKWVAKLVSHQNRTYERYTVNTSLGSTHIWGVNTKKAYSDTLVIFPGARTTALIWDFDKGLDNLNHNIKIYMVETNGLPNLSDGITPDIKSLDFGHWAAEVLDQLQIEQTYIAGASYGGLISMKLAITHPEKIKAAFILNPGCLQPFSMKWSNLYYNLLPIFSPSTKNVSRFLDKAIFSKPTHQVSDFAEQMLIDYEVFAIKQYKDNTQKPYYMGKQLAEVKADTYLLLGDKDMLFPTVKSIENAKKHISTLVDVKVFENVGHGIETYAGAMKYIGEKIKSM